MAAVELQITTLRQDANLKGYWRMSSNSTDEKGNHNGTDSNVSYTTGQFGNAASFNGTSSKIDLANPTTNLPSGSGDRTIVAWIKPSTIPNYGPIFSYGTTSANAGFQWGWNATTAKLLLGKYGANADASSSTTISTGVWSHVAVKLVGSTVTYYLNGSTDGTATLSGVNTSLTDARIGKAIPGWDAPDGAYYFDGLIDDIAIFDRALTNQEISDLYNGTGTTTSTSSSTSTTSTSSSTSTTSTSTSTTSTSSSTSTTSTSSSTTTTTSSSTSSSTTITVTTTSTSTTTTSTSTTSTSSSTSTTSTSSSTSSSSSSSTTITKEYSFSVQSIYTGYKVVKTNVSGQIEHGDK